MNDDKIKNDEEIALVIGERLKKARLQLRMTQDEFGKRINKSRVTVFNYENGKSGYNTRYLKLVSKELNISYVYLITGELPIITTSQETLMHIIKEDYNLDLDELQFVKAFLQMSKEERISCIKTIKIFSSAINNK